MEEFLFCYQDIPEQMVTLDISLHIENLTMDILNYFFFTFHRIYNYKVKFPYDCIIGNFYR